MGYRPREPGPAPRLLQPRKAELLEVLDQTALALAALLGRWGDGIPATVRLEIRQIHEPLLHLLIRAKRR